MHHKEEIDVDNCREDWINLVRMPFFNVSSGFNGLKPRVCESFLEKKQETSIIKEIECFNKPPSLLIPTVSRAYLPEEKKNQKIYESKEFNEKKVFSDRIQENYKKESKNSQEIKAFVPKIENHSQSFEKSENQLLISLIESLSVELLSNKISSKPLKSKIIEIFEKIPVLKENKQLKDLVSLNVPLCSTHLKSGPIKLNCEQEHCKECIEELCFRKISSTTLIKCPCGKVISQKNFDLIQKNQKIEEVDEQEDEKMNYLSKNYLPANTLKTTASNNT